MNTEQDYEIHPYALCWLKPTNYEEIKASIKEHGQLERITIFENKILDGVQRYRICLELGIEPLFDTPTITDPFSYVLAKNRNRRHLTKGQIAMALAKMVKLQPGRPKANGVVTTPLKKTLPQLAVAGGVSPSELDRARHILRNESPEIIQAVESGTLTTSIARQNARRQNSVPNPVDLHDHQRRRGEISLFEEAIDDARKEQENLEAEQQAIIDVPSLYPIDAELPTHPTRPEHTKHIREGIEELRKNEPLIGKMGRGQLFKLIHTYTQRIQTYGLFRAENRVVGPIDERFVHWAGEVFLKLRARERILQSRRKFNTQKRESGKSLAKRTPSRRSDEFHRLLKSFTSKFKYLLQPFPPQYEESLTIEVLARIKEHFAAKREAYANRTVLHPNGARTPVKN